MIHPYIQRCAVKIQGSNFLLLPLISSKLIEKTTTTTREAEAIRSREKNPI